MELLDCTIEKLKLGVQRRDLLRGTIEGCFESTVESIVVREATDGAVYEITALDN